MASELAQAAQRLADELRSLAAVHPASVEVTVDGETLVARCTVQPEGDHEVAEFIRKIEEDHGVKVNFTRIPIQR